MYSTIFSLGAFQFHSYGLMVAIGVFVAILFLRAHAKEVKIDADGVVDLALVTLLAGFLGARIFYVVEFWDSYQNSWLDALKVWQGGIVVYGGLMGGFVGFFLFIRLRRLPLLPLFDLFMPAVALAQGFGRIGCFLNGCCYGTEYSGPLAVQFPFLDYRVHPTQLYESAFCFLLFLFLYSLWRNRVRIPTGAVTVAYFNLYAVWRFGIEFLRGDNAKAFLHLTVAQWISLVIFILSLFVYFCFLINGRKNTSRSS